MAEGREMKRPSIYNDRRAPLDVKMTPMIDVVFLLLVFFVWTASFQIAEYAMPSKLAPLAGDRPSNPQTPPPEADFDRVIVRLMLAAAVAGDSGRVQWTVNDAPMADLAQLHAQLDAIASIKRDAPVILHPDPNVPLGDVIDVYDISRRVGFVKIQFAASEGI
jgi:biopolymer transport protein ExbD